MPVLRPSGSDFTSFVKAAAQYVPSGGGGKVSKSGGVSVALPGLGAVVRTSQVGALASPRTSAVVINGITPQPVVASAVVPTSTLSLPISAGGIDAFIVKYSVTGVVQWSAVIQGTGSDGGFAVATDSTGVYVTGRYTSTSPVDLGYGKTLPISVSQDAFIVKYSVTGVVQWSAVIQGTGGDTGSAITTDSTGVYVIGNYTSTSPIDLGYGKTLPISVSQDVFIVKYNTSGEAQWSAVIQGTGSDGGFAVATDSTGVYVTGRYTSTSPVDLGYGKTLPISVSQDVFIVKYSVTGVVQWSAVIQGTGSDTGSAITTDSTGVYVTGHYTSTSPVDLGYGKTLPISVGQDMFIVKYNTSGVTQWSAVIQGTGGDTGSAITTDSTGVYVIGNYTSTSPIDLGYGKTLPISVSQDVFIVKYNTSGEAQWSAVIQGTGSDGGTEITTDSTGVYVTGNYTSTSPVDLGYEKTLPISVGSDGYIVKYNTSGVTQWSAVIQGAGSDNPNGITTDSTGVYMTGHYTSTSPVDLGYGKTLPISVGQDMFIVKYNTSGVTQWSAVIQGTGSDLGSGITIDSTGVYASGYYTSTSPITLTNGI